MSESRPEQSEERRGRDVGQPERSVGNPTKREGRDVGSEDEVRKRQKIQRQLDEALADSFPASDPVSIVTSNEEEDWGAAPDPATENKPSPEDAPKGRSR